MGFTTLVVIAAILSTVAAQAPFDPEEMLFIYTRCMEDNLPSDASTRSATFLKWKDWKLEPQDSNLQCYVKCVLDKTGLYNPSTKKFDVDVIKKQSEKYPNPADKSIVDAYTEAVKKLSSPGDDCKAVFTAYATVLQNHETAMKNLFHGNKERTKSIYEDLGINIRQMKQSYFEYCENKYYPPKTDAGLTLCQIRKYEVLKDDHFKKHTECIMKGLRYITKNNELDREEIKRDFKQVGKETAALEQALNKCQKPSKDASWSYYKCLVESSVAADFKEAFDYREVRSQYYAYNLAEKRKYSKPAVQSQVEEIDGKQCPSSAA